MAIIDIVRAAPYLYLSVFSQIKPANFVRSLFWLFLFCWDLPQLLATMHEFFIFAVSFSETRKLQSYAFSIIHLGCIDYTLEVVYH